MRKVILWAVFVCLGTGAFAEEMQFITTLSSPVGTFAQLETADPTERTYAPVVNFCTSRSSVGRINLVGANAYVQRLHLAGSTVLGGSLPEFRIVGSMQVNNGGRVAGGRLMGTQVKFTNAYSAKSKVNGSLYMNSATVVGAKAAQLTISSEVETSGTGTGKTMEWSNTYSRDYSSSGAATGKSYSSYLLKGN